ncbi:MAG TPA: hypothetical protein VMD79_14245 [Solirubrobacteraceae bacterium]|nr:hypothetical protein [Solirubrobacteraceae bacterium]
MKGISRIGRILACAIALLGVFASVSAAAPAGGHGGVAPDVGKMVTTWTTRYDASEYYGEVECTGKTIVNKRYPGSKDVEFCHAVTGTLAHMKAGKGQTSFETSSGGFVSEWESDSGDGLRTTDFTYKVNKQLTQFKLVAIY